MADCPNDIHTHRVNVYALGLDGTPLWMQLQGGARPPLALRDGVVLVDEFNTATGRAFWRLKAFRRADL